MLQELSKCCGRINSKRSTCDDEQITLLTSLDRRIDILMFEILFIKDDIRANDAAALIALGDSLLRRDILDIKLLAAIHAIIAEYGTVKFYYALTAGFLMQIIDILCDYRLELTLLLKPDKSLVSLIRLGIGIDELTLIKIKEDIRILYEEIMGNDVYRSVGNAGILIIDSRAGTEIRDTALGGHTCATQKYNILRLRNKLLQLLDLAVPYASEPV